MLQMTSAFDPEMLELLKSVNESCESCKSQIDHLKGATGVVQEDALTHIGIEEGESDILTAEVAFPKNAVYFEDAPEILLPKGGSLLIEGHQQIDWSPLPQDIVDN